MSVSSYVKDFLLTATVSKLVNYGLSFVSFVSDLSIKGIVIDCELDPRLSFCDSVT